MGVNFINYYGLRSVFRQFYKFFTPRQVKSIFREWRTAFALILIRFSSSVVNVLWGSTRAAGFSQPVFLRQLSNKSRSRLVADGSHELGVVFLAAGRGDVVVRVVEVSFQGEPLVLGHIRLAADFKVDDVVLQAVFSVVAAMEIVVVSLLPRVSVKPSEAELCHRGGGGVPFVCAGALPAP